MAEEEAALTVVSGPDQVRGRTSWDVVVPVRKANEPIRGKVQATAPVKAGRKFAV